MGYTIYPIYSIYIKLIYTRLTEPVSDMKQVNVHYLDVKL